MMFDAANQIFYPPLYDVELTNQRAFHIIANNIIGAMKERPGEHGGWVDPVTALKARPMLKDLAKVLFHVIPHADAFRQRGNSLPPILIRCAREVTEKRKDIPKKYTRELCQAHYRMMDQVIGHNLFNSKCFKFQPTIKSLQSALADQPAKLVKLASGVNVVQTQTAETRAPKDKQSYPIWKKSKKPRTDVSRDLLMDRLHTGLATLDNYQPLQIDSLLFTQDERDSFEVAHAAGKLNNPRQKRFDRLNWLQTSAAFSDSIWFYQYSTGGAGGGWLHFIWKIPGDTLEDDSMAEVSTQSLQAITRLKQCREVPVYMTRLMLQEFKDRYRDIEGASSSILAELASFITGDESAGRHGEADKETRKRIKLWLDQSCQEDAEEVIVDLRRLRRNPVLYDNYWTAMGAYMAHNAEVTRVDDRRHGSTCRFPDDWSITTLVESIIQFAADNKTLTTLDPEKDVPTTQWVRNFGCRFHPIILG